MEYEIEEATYMMEAAADAAKPDLAARTEASSKLMQAIVKAAENTQFLAAWDRKEAGVWLSATSQPDDGCYLAIDSTGAPALRAPHSGEFQRIPELGFFPSRNRWEGLLRDKFRNPAPEDAGKPARRRDAAAVVIEAAFKKIMRAHARETE